LNGPFGGIFIQFTVDGDPPTHAYHFLNAVNDVNFAADFILADNQQMEAV
jgi:hypothetical protein